LRDAFGPRVIPAVVTGDAAGDLSIIRRAAAAPPTSRSTCSALAKSTSTTLSCLRALRRGGRWC